MPATESDYKKVKSAQSKAASLSKESAQYAQGATGLNAQVMEAVRADRTQRGVSTMATDVGTTLGQIPTDTAGIRARAGDIVNPMATDVMTAQQRGQNLQTLGTQAYQSEYNQGTLTDILGEHASQLQAIAQSKAYEAQQAATEAENLMAEIQFKRQQELDAWNQYVDQQNLAQGWAQINKPTGGGGGGVEGWDDYLKLYNALKPTSSEQDRAVQAGSGKSSLEAAAEIIKNNPGALKWAKSGVLSFIGGQDALSLKKHLSNASDIISRMRTGAQLNKQEEKFYNQFIADPMAVFSGKGVQEVEEATSILGSIFDKIIAQGRDPREILGGDLSGVGGDYDPLGIRE